MDRGNSGAAVTSSSTAARSSRPSARPARAHSEGGSGRPRGSRRARSPVPTGLVFVNTVGNPPHASGFTAFTWARAKRRAGIEGVRWHDLRHTAVALAIEQGAHAKAVQERMGHAGVSVTAS